MIYEPDEDEEEDCGCSGYVDDGIYQVEGDCPISQSDGYYDK